MLKIASTILIYISGNFIQYAKCQWLFANIITQLRALGSIPQGVVIPSNPIRIV